MRILAVEPGPNFSVADVHAGWVEAFRELGHQVASYNLSERLTFYSRAAIQLDTGEYRTALQPEQAIELAINGLYSALYRLRPDIMFVTSGFFMTADLMETTRRNGTRIVLMHTESPYQDDEQLIRAPYADVNLINDPIGLQRFRDLAPTYYMPHAYRPSVHYRRPFKAEYASDVAFVGTGYASRIAFLEAVDWSGIDLTIAGQWTELGEDSPLRTHLAHAISVCVDNHEAVELYSCTKGSLNLYRQEANSPELVAGWAMGPREVELAAMGTFFLRQPRADGEGDRLLPMLPTFDSPAEFGDKVRWWLSHDDQRQAAAQTAQAAVADRTFANNVKALTSILDA